jgi:hypothetical protein
MKRTFLPAFLLVIVSVAGNGQTNKQLTDPLLGAPSNFKLLATNVSYRGENCSPSAETDKVYFDSSEVVRAGDDVYYQAHRFYRTGRGDGLVAENFAAKTCRVYPMFGLAEAAGWFKPKERGVGTPNATRGLFRVGNSLWMGSNGIGVAIFDLERKTWSRIDLKSSVVAGDHVGVDYADDNYVFVTRGEFPSATLHIYSVKQNRWLGLKAVSTELVREFGYTTGMVQVGVDHRIFAKQKYLSVDWSLMYPQITPTNNGESYLYEKKFSESKTAFEISKSQLEQVFMKSS